MENPINLEIRSQVLEYSLETENYINTLLLSYLGILDKTKTKNFGNKAGISFKNKIDLLCDINVLDKLEHSNIEFQMFFRNKFLHDIESNSFTNILLNAENDIKNRFKKFLEVPNKKEDEKAYENAYRNLYFHNLKIINRKYKERRESLENRSEYLSGLYDANIAMSSLASNFAQEIYLILENCQITNKETLSLFKTISEKCEKFSKDYKLVCKNNEEMVQKYETPIISGKISI